ncbi:MAG: hypothetical protein ACI9FB_004315 [Candidatus Azotimanducaceae bacterium]|jgi:hypothetical protein
MKYLLLFNLIFLCNVATFADWTINNDASSLSFVTIKNGSVVESHTFKTFSGSANSQGDISVEIDLSSTDTQIPIRDERIANLLFETKIYPKAILKAKLDLTPLLGMTLGESAIIQFDAGLNLHGIQAKLPLNVRVTKITASKMMVSSVKALVIDGNDYNLLGGINALRNIAGLKAITQNVPVNFSLIFEQIL